jgi:Na+:H+ antiporter, NhaA family
MRKTKIDKWVIEPIGQFISDTTTSGIVLFAAAVVALCVANSPWAEAYHNIWQHKLSIGYDEYVISKDLHHWINDGLMAVFFFVIGLELKREIMAGELSSLKDALLPLMAGLGGMAVPALIYLWFNGSGPQQDGWGIPMATDIAFALGILYMLGDRVPKPLKIFLTALAIADDIGAVLVIAFFYTSDVSLLSLGIGVAFLAILVGGNLLGVRSPLFYGIIGIGGLWLAFLTSGIHATVAGVLAALTIPGGVKIKNQIFAKELRRLAREFEDAKTIEYSLVSEEQLDILEEIRYYSKAALTPLQRLENALYPLVAFIIMPVFALANAGITFSGSFFENVGSNVTLGIIAGLVAGKLVGIAGISRIVVALKLARLPEGVGWRHILGAAMLAAVGFTMSLFITELAFNDPELILQAKFGVLIASSIGGTAGYFLLRKLG